MWKKVLYVAVATIFGIVLFFVTYMSNQVNYIYDLIGDALTSEKYYDAVSILNGGYFDTKSIVTDTTDKMELIIYPATTITDVSYKAGEDTKKHHHCENAYYINIFNPSFDSSVISNSNTQKTGIRFNSSEYSYDYYFVADETYNSNSYVSEPKSLSEALLNQKRSIIMGNEERNILMMPITFSESMLNEIKIKLGNQPILSIEILQNDGEPIYKENVHLDFSETYFSDMKDFVEHFDQYIVGVNAAGDDSDKKKELGNAFQEYYDAWMTDVFSKYEEKGYTKGVGDEVVSPGSLVWKTIGILALYALVIVMFYILLFHFKFVRRIFSKDTYKNYGSKNKGTYVNGKMVEDKNVVNSKPVKKRLEKPSKEAPVENNSIDSTSNVENEVPAKEPVDESAIDTSVEEAAPAEDIKETETKEE